jgi:hypothetical protein
LLPLLLPFKTRDIQYYGGYYGGYFLSRKTHPHTTLIHSVKEDCHIVFMFAISLLSIKIFVTCACTCSTSTKLCVVHYDFLQLQEETIQNPKQMTTVVSHLSMQLEPAWFVRT